MNEIRLIDANALKEDLKQYFTDGVLAGVSAKLTFNQILCDIDNAPTISPSPIICNITEEDIKKFKTIWQMATSNGLFAVNEEKPQGEWINTRPPEMSDNIVCSLCGYDSIASFNYCPNCGAEMKEGEDHAVD